jgi:hypothetical protein
MNGGDLERALGRIEGMLDGVQKELQRIAGYSASTSERVGALEQWKSRTIGLLAGAGAAGGGVAALVQWLFVST